MAAFPSAAGASRRALVIFVTLLLTGTHSPHEQQDQRVVLTTTKSAVSQNGSLEENLFPVQVLPAIENAAVPFDGIKGHRQGLARIHAAFVRWKAKEKEKLASLFRGKERAGDGTDVLLEELIGLVTQLVASHLFFRFLAFLRGAVARCLGRLGLKAGEGAAGRGGKETGNDTYHLLSPLATASESTVYIKEFNCKSSVRFLSCSPSAVGSDGEGATHESGIQGTTTCPTTGQ